MNACGKFDNSILVAVFDAESGQEEAIAPENIAFKLRRFADFVEHNGHYLAPSTFETYEAFKGGYRQWSATREAELNTQAQKKEKP